MSFKRAIVWGIAIAGDIQMPLYVETYADFTQHGKDEVNEYLGGLVSISL